MSVLSDAEKEEVREAYNRLVSAQELSPRWGQRQMIAEVANTFAQSTLNAAEDASESAASNFSGAGDAGRESALNGQHIALIEAGTGTGKTIAYVIPGVVMAKARGKRLLIATATVALQEQLIHKDLPAIGASSGLDFNFVLAKGRRRYLCLSQLDRVLERESPSNENLWLYPDELEPDISRDAYALYQKMLEALARGDWDGDRDNWPDPIEDSVWYPLTADQSQVAGRPCAHGRSCSSCRARDGIQEAEVIVTNHDLVLADLALGGGVIFPKPEELLYVFDEGHHLPDKALQHFASFCRIGSTRSWLGDCRKAFTRGEPLLSELPGLATSVESLPQQFQDIVDALERVEMEAATLLAEHAIAEQLRFPRGVVPEGLRSVAQEQEGLWSRLSATTRSVANGIERALDADDELSARKDELDHWQRAVAGIELRATSNLALWSDFAGGIEIKDGSLPRARWLSQGGQDAAAVLDFHSSRVLAADLLSSQLWDRAAAVVLTSATMTALGRFDRFVFASGVPSSARQKIVSSPFDYARGTFAIPAMRSDPSDSLAHTEEVLERLPELLATGAGSLVLFSSRRQLNDVFDGLPLKLQQLVLKQDDHSKQELLKRHRETVDGGSASVIFGLASFAEGVDLPGDYCRHVVIAKLPFPVPDNPIDATLAEWIEDQGKNSFMEISVPEAALRLVQASGRLLRTEKDSGRITLLDRRLLTRRYGNAILESLPPFNRDFH
ncbi:MAG: ATP-dependent DNA helicase DinG [Pseudomonadota bacterium]